MSEGLRRLDVRPAEFKNKLEDLLKETQSSETAADNKKMILASMSTLATHAFVEAALSGHESVTPPDLFAALGTVKDGFMIGFSIFLPLSRRFEARPYSKFRSS